MRKREHFYGREVAIHAKHEGDKFIQPFVGYENIYTGEIQWYNQGIYLINAPSYSYDATNNTLSFSGLDLMSKLTGLRNGA